MTPLCTASFPVTDRRRRGGGGGEVVRWERERDVFVIEVAYVHPSRSRKRALLEKGTNGSGIKLQGGGSRPSCTRFKRILAAIGDATLDLLNRHGKSTVKRFQTNERSRRSGRILTQYETTSSRDQTNGRRCATRRT